MTLRERQTIHQTFLRQIQLSIATRDIQEVLTEMGISENYVQERSRGLSLKH
jgi:hypothetical protein